MSEGNSAPIVRLCTLVAVTLALICAEPLCAAGQTAGWVQFHDLQTGLSFRYPPDLRVRRRDARKFGLPRVKSIVDLVGDTRANPGTTVLRFLVRRGYTSPAERTKRVRQLRRACRKTSPMMVDGQRAIVCLSAGSAAVRWSVEILGPRECTILTLLGGADYEQSLPPPHDGEFPLLSIIRSVHFAPASRPRVR